MTRREARGGTSIECVLSPPGKKKLTAVERLVQEQMLAMLEWASERPDKWYAIGNLEATKKAAELLAKRGVIEIWDQAVMYRIKPKK
jgi:hypothetical protein